MIRCYLLLLLLSIAPAPGAQVPDAVTREINALPEAPLNYLLDEGDLFGRHPHQFEMIAERLVAFVSAHDLPVYVVVYAGLMDSNLIRRANFLFDKWIGPEGDGVVLVYNSDTMEYQLVLPQKGLASFRDGQGSPARLLEFQLSPIDRELEVTLDGVEDRIDYLNRTTEILCQRLDEILSQEPPGAQPDRRSFLHELGGGRSWNRSGAHAAGGLCQSPPAAGRGADQGALLLSGCDRRGAPGSTVLWRSLQRGRLFGCNTTGT